ncbi:MAG: TIGR03435 family protein [Acidobacteria bacterium]|nr:TIGR03435 family protein [Acidobacteriota bacterium]
MKRILTGLGLGVFALVALAQDAPPAFEVASIKQAAPQPQGRMMVRMGGDAGRVDYASVSLKDVLARAYNVKRFQITGPSWLDSERYDITAKVPDGVNPDKIPVMLQALLAERFKMQVHRETKEQSVYALIVGKSGPKLTKSEIETNPNAKPPIGPDGRPMPRGGRGMMMMQIGGPSGTAQMKATAITMGTFSDMLSNMLDRPVVDQTGILGNYDLTLDVSMEDMAGMRKIAVPPPGAGGPGMEHAPAEGGSAASIFTSIQSLGLKLDPRKAPVEYLVVDRAEKVPTEN